MHPFRFGVNFLTPGSRDEWVGKCRKAEELGYDVLLAPDHLGMPAPFPSLVLAGAVTERPRLGTYVMNAGFWNPAVLAREVATTDRLTGGRLELGLGTGYLKAEFEAAGLPWDSPREKVDRLEHTVAEVSRLLADPAHQPRPATDAGPPLMIGGAGERVLRFAAAKADIFSLSGAKVAHDSGPVLIDAAAVAERVAFFDRHAAGRAVEKNIMISAVVVTADRRAAARQVASWAPGLTDEQILDHPMILVGTHDEIVAQVLRNREVYGFSYLTLLEWAAEDFAPVMKELRQAGG